MYRLFSSEAGEDLWEFKRTVAGDETFHISSSLLFRPWLLLSSKYIAILAASLGGEREKGPVVSFCFSLKITQLAVVKNMKFLRLLAPPRVDVHLSLLRTQSAPFTLPLAKDLCGGNLRNFQSARELGPSIVN